MTAPATCAYPGCDSTSARPYLTGPHCPPHTPAALAGRPEAYVDPERTLEALERKAGRTYAYRRSDSSLIDDRAVASGKRRSSARVYRLARAGRSTR